MVVSTHGKIPYFVILSGRPGYVKVDFKRSEPYAELLQAEKEHKLPKTVRPDVIARAALYATPEMFVNVETDPETYQETRTFKEELIVCEADENGRILIERDKPELARQILRELRVLDPQTFLDLMGLMLPEEIPEDERKPVNKGGRGRTNEKFLGGDTR